MMLNYLNSVDAALFVVINRDFGNIFFDRVMPLVSFAGNSGAIWILLAVLLGLKNRRFGLSGFVVVLLALLSSFLLADELLKHLFVRPRPFLDIAQVNLLIEAPKDFSFPSGHSATAFAAATATALLDRRLAPAVLMLAVLEAYSRVYVGVHYPFDVIAGALVGVFTGWFIVVLAKSRRRRRYFRWQG
jgi:undecaprenyl-diphosphatase